MTPAQRPVVESIELAVDRSVLPTLAAFAEAFGERVLLSAADSFALQLVVEETVLNVIEYGGMAGGEPGVTVTLSADASELVIEVRDRGVPYDPLLVNTPQIDLDVEARTIGGLGVFLCRSYTDAQHYARTEHENVLTLRRSRTTQTQPT